MTISPESFKGKHQGELAIIACNGPGLNNVNCPEISKHVVFGLNRGYLKEDLRITYLVTEDPTIEQQFRREMEALKCEAKFSNGLHGDDVVKIFPVSMKPCFTPDISGKIWGGNSVTFAALQVAFYLGCDPVYIVGMDHHIRYDRAKKRGHLFENKGEDPNHFRPDYFGKGVRYNHQNLEYVEGGYKLAAEAYASAGRRLRNASYPTALSSGVIEREFVPEFMLVEEDVFWSRHL
jgi:hypothetical protein